VLPIFSDLKPSSAKVTVVVLFQPTSRRLLTCARTPMRICLLPSPVTFTIFYITSFRLSLKGLNTTIYVNVHTAQFNRPPLSNWTSHRQELYTAHAVLELVLGIRLLTRLSIDVHCFILSFLYSRCVLSAF